MALRAASELQASGNDPWRAMPTRVCELERGLLMKFEMDNAGASHKVRAARYVVQSALRRGDLVPGRTTVIEKTGGNFGLGLALACAEINVPVELAVGLSFSPLKRRYLQCVGATLIGVDRLQGGATPRDVLQWHLDHARSLGRSYFYPDQFNNADCVTAHEVDTGAELVAQLRAQWPQVTALRFVACAGTGAHLTGIGRALHGAGYATQVTLVEPAGCISREGIFVNHRLEGMAVGVKPPLLDWGLVDDCVAVEHEDVLATQRQLARVQGFLIGTTSAACLFVARGLLSGLPPHSKALTIAYDHGAWSL